MYMHVHLYVVPHITNRLFMTGIHLICIAFPYTGLLFTCMWSTTSSIKSPQIVHVYIQQMV